MTLHLIPLLLCSALISLTMGDTQCSNNQACLKREECPSVNKLYNEFLETKDQNILSELQSKICNQEEKKFCCDCYCVERQKCPSIVKLYEDLKQAEDPDKKKSLVKTLTSKICNKEEKKFLCCDEVPLTTTTTTTTTTPTPQEPKNGTYLPRLEDGTCGRIAGSSEFLYGGEDTKLGEFPFTALLRTKGRSKSDSDKFTCGGNLINTRYVLTAAHCYSEARPLNLVRLGEYRFIHETEGELDCVDDKCLPPVQDFVVSNDDFTIHQDYEHNIIKKTVTNDIGLIRLPREAEINVGVRLVCLPLSLAGKSLENPHNRVTIVGWGYTNAKDERKSLESNNKLDRIATPTQQKGEMTLVTLEFCKEKWGQSYGTFIDGQVCAYNNIDKVSTCKGDSGGPMYGREAGTGVDGEDNSQEPWTLLGITSFGTTRCSTVGARPAVFTKVSFYIDWIKEHLKP